MPSLSSASTTHPDIPPFPSPSTFSLLPDIYLLTARLNLLHQQSTQSQILNGTTQPSQPTIPSTQTRQSQTQTQTQFLTSQTSAASQIPPSILNNLPLLEPKDLPGQMYPFKQKLAKARASVSALPDVDRTVEEQQVEIRRLEAIIRALRARLELLGEIARDRRDVEMGEADEEV